MSENRNNLPKGITVASINEVKKAIQDGSLRENEVGVRKIYVTCSDFESVCRKETVSLFLIENLFRLWPLKLPASSNFFYY